MSAIEHLKSNVSLSLEAKQDFYRTQSQAIIEVAEKMGKTVKSGGKILIFGNGGSAADAQHMAAEMVGRMLVPRKKPIPAIALSTDTSAITAIANDFSYDDIFAMQLEGLGRKGDLCIAISTSGNSKNVINAVQIAKRVGIYVVSLTGSSGGKLKEISDANLNVALGKNSSMTQETHISIVHNLVDLMDRFFLSPEYVQL